LLTFARMSAVTLGNVDVRAAGRLGSAHAARVSFNVSGGRVVPDADDHFRRNAGVLSEKMVR
jgi:hypothetical protein